MFDRSEINNEIRFVILDVGCTECARTYIEHAGYQRPDEKTFNRYLSFFLSDLPNEDCAKAGRPSYGAVILNQNKTSIIFYDLSVWKSRKIKSTAFHSKCLLLAV